jgi:tetratricopeptide (TPR) repeat protein
MRTLVMTLVLALAAFGQRHKLEEVDAEKPEGKLLQQCMQETDAPKKAALMEQFAGQFPKAEQTAWVLEQLQAYYVKAGQPDQIISAGDRLLAADPDDPEAALQALKAAEAKKDIALVQKFSDKTYANGMKMASAPQPKEADRVDSWKQEVDYAKQVATYADYALFRAAVESRDPKLTIEVGEKLLARSPNSEYAAKTRDPLFLAYRQTKADDKALALAEKVLATEQTNEDMLLVVSNSYLEQKKSPEKLHAYSAKIVEVMNAKPKPEGTSDADWTARKNLIVGLAHYISGKQYFNDKKYQPSDQELRLALPLVETNASLKPETLFMLGVDNFNLEKIQDAANYFRTCSVLKSPLQAEATKNLARIKRDYQGVK